MRIDQVRNLIDRAEEVGDDGGRPERHLAPGQDVAHESRDDHQHVDDHAENPQNLAGRLIRAVIEASEDVDVDREEKERRAVGVHVAQQPAIVDVAHDVFDAVEGHRRIGHVVHREHDASDDLHAQHEGEDRAESVPDVQIPGRRKSRHRVVRKPQDRQTRVEPAGEAGFRFVG
jgi:hypothetical protein